jgi:hypothetical protein
LRGLKRKLRVTEKESSRKIVALGMISMTLSSGKGRTSGVLLVDKWWRDLVWFLWFLVFLESENPLESESTSSERIFKVGLHNNCMYMW